MKTKTLVSIISILVLCGSALLLFAIGEPTELWTVRYGYWPILGPDYARRIAVDPSGNIVVTGESFSSSTRLDWATIKYDCDGRQSWVRRYNNALNGDDLPHDLALDSAGNIYVTGTVWGQATSWDYATIKYDPHGNVLWARTYSGNPVGQEEAVDIEVDAGGNVYVTGFSNGGVISDQMTWDYATIKYDKYGNELWIQRYDGPAGTYDQAVGIAVDGDGNAYVTGTSVGTGTGFDYATIKYLGDGTVAWVRRYHRADDRAADIAVDDYGNICVTGRSGWGRSDYLTVKYDSAGNELWVKTYDGLGGYTDSAVKVIGDREGNFYITGYSYAADPSWDHSWDYVTIKYDVGGNQSWLARYDGPANGADIPDGIAIDGSGNIYVTGESRGLVTGPDYATVKYRPDGTEEWVKRYDSSAGSDDRAHAVAVDDQGNVYVTGESLLSGQVDFLTIKYGQNSSPVAKAGGPYSATEGTPITLDATGSNDPDGDVLAYEWDLDGDGEYDDATGPTPSFSWPDNIVSLSIGLKVTDEKGASATDAATVTVLNALPKIISMSAPIDPVPLNTSISFGAEFTDAGVLDTHAAVWDWGGGTTSAGTVTETNGSGTVAGSHAYTTPGIYTVTLTVTDKDGGVATATSALIVVYDPTGEFVTGAGWFMSPAGAFAADPGLTGRAHFGIMSKYQKGATVPTGETKFHFQAADLNFHSDTYEWMVVAGAKVQYKGTGTINGSGSYRFMITAIDGGIPGGGGLDKFRIRIWGDSGLIYDNEVGSPENGDPTTVIAAGSIVIHK